VKYYFILLKHDDLTKADGMQLGEIEHFFGKQLTLKLFPIYL
jgi:hypothetical protein